MLIDLEELAGNIASKVDGAGLTPVIEKEIVHYEIIRSLGRNGLLQDITFQGGTSLRLCYGSQRYSEDLDFVAGDKFDSLPLDDFSRTLRCDLLRSYDTEVSVREPKVVNDLDGVGMRRWTVSVNTNIARPDLPKQRIKLEIASVPAHTSTVRRVAVNYPELAGMYDDLTIRCQTLEEILADKLISFSATDTHIRHRDLWDIPWIVRAQEIDFPAVAVLVAAKHDDYRCPVPLARMIATGTQRARVCYAIGDEPVTFEKIDRLGGKIELCVDNIGQDIEKVRAFAGSSPVVRAFVEPLCAYIPAPSDSVGEQKRDISPYLRQTAQRCQRISHPIDPDESASSARCATFGGAAALPAHRGYKHR